VTVRIRRLVEAGATHRHYERICIDENKFIGKRPMYHANSPEIARLAGARALDARRLLEALR
jgi:hypothetical protein